MNTEYWLSAVSLVKLGYLNLMIWWILLHQSCRFFSLHRGRKTGGLLFHFILSKIVAFGTGASFSCFSAEESGWYGWAMGGINYGRDPFNQHSDRSDREKRTTSKGGPVFSKLFRLDRTDPLSFGPKFPEILVEWIAPYVYLHDVLAPRSYPIFTLESKYGGRSRRRSDNEKTVF